MPTSLGRSIIRPLFAIAVVSAAPAWAGPTFSYTSFDPPPGVDSSVGDSQASGISNTGVIIGTYYSADGTAHGYELNNGVYTYFDAPGAGTTNHNGTQGISVNSAGQAIFSSTDNSGHQTSYLYSAGTYMAINDPLASNGTFVHNINDNGIATGTYYVGTFGVGFQYNVATATFQSFSLIIHNSGGTFGQATSASGDILINYASGIVQFSYGSALFRHNGGGDSFFSVPGAMDTFAQGINSSGMISGNYGDIMSTHAFEYIDGTYYTLAYPNASSTTLFGINDAGQAVGYYVSAGESHSFLVTGVPEPGGPVKLAGLAATLIPAGVVYRRRSARK